MNLTATNETDIFLDLEGVGVGTPPFGGGARLTKLLAHMLPHLYGLGYTIRTLWGTACLKRHDFILPGTLQIDIKQALTRHGGVMHWTKELADTALIREVERRLEDDTLASIVLLIACDHHFTGLVKKLRFSGRTVIVSGRMVSKKLAKAATSTISLSELIGEDMEWSERKTDVPFNGIPLPPLTLP